VWLLSNSRSRNTPQQQYTKGRTREAIATLQREWVDIAREGLELARGTALFDHEPESLLEDEPGDGTGGWEQLVLYRFQKI
jgi:hypothetical protein